MRQKFQPLHHSATAAVCGNDVLLLLELSLHLFLLMVLVDFLVLIPRPEFNIKAHYLGNWLLQLKILS